MTYPDGWTPIHDWIKNCTVLCGEPGLVTIDFGKRIFGRGAGQPGAWRDGIHYSGKGWQQRIIDDAVAYVIAVTSGNPPRD